MSYQTKHFRIEELVSDVVVKMVPPHRLWWLFDERLLITADRLRERYGRTIINDWIWGGNLHYCGFREMSASVGAEFSDHKFGRALDCHFENVSAEEVRNDILADPWHPDFEYITCLEMSINGVPISWLHISTRNHDKRKYGIQQLCL